MSGDTVSPPAEVVELRAPGAPVGESVGDGLGVGATTQEEVQQEPHARVAQFQPSLGS